MRRLAWIPRLEEGTLGRQQVIQITCDRCTRVEHRPPRPEDDKPDGARRPVFVGEYKGKMVSFEDLCSGCEEIVSSRFGEIAKQLTKASPIRKDKK